ncbi:hypothetical protein JTE90_023501 [Oedothorax gibbosus]|uniref:Rho-GAP domain-containing protein n=1 Tax=Oedothorax gibbosus TaxID=931172 RepID=A0AAV6VSL3_9ARAC|nr:hypothetical protein JTE90_023501 [Oedothorax gibbosus]
MKFCLEDKDMLNSALAQLKEIGIKVPKIKKMKTAISKQDNKGPIQSKIFGVCLADQERCNNSNPPKFILSCTEYLQKYSKEVGLFRKAGSISRQKKLRVKIESGGSLEGAEPNDVASLLKQWLRELPEPLVPSYLYDSFIRCQSLNDGNRTTAALLLCLLLPPEHLVTMKHLMGFLAYIATYKAINKMDFENLALIITPNIFVFRNNSIDQSSLKVQQLTSIAELLIKNASQIGEIPQSLLFKFPIGEGKCESETNSLSEAVESSPSLSRKHYLLRSIKRLVKPNGTVANSTVTPESGHHFLRHTLSVSNMEKASLKSISENKVSYNFFGSRNSEDVCKRSFRLLRKKDKRGLAPNQEFHPFTQSLEIERPLNYQVEIDHMKIFPPNRHAVVKSSSGSFFNYNSFDDSRPVLEDIEMITFSIRLNEPSDHLVAFPIFSQSIGTNNFDSKLENQTTKYLQVSPLNTSKTNNNRGKSINFSKETNALIFTEKSKGILPPNSDYPMDNEGMSQPKGSATSFTFPENSYNFSNGNVSLFQNLMGDSSDFSVNDSTSSKTCIYKTQFLMADKDCSNKVLGKNYAENTETYQLLRQNTFVIEPDQNNPTEQIKRPCIDEQNSKRSNTDNLEEYGISSKKPCTNTSMKAKGNNKNEPVKKIASKSVNSERSSVKKSRPSLKPTPIQKNRNETSIKGCSSLTIKEDIKVFHDQTPPSKVLHHTANLRSSSKREVTTQQTFASCLTKSTFSENTKSVPKDYSNNNLAHKRKLSFQRYPVSTSSHSDSKIPRFRNSFEISTSNSFNEDVTGRTRNAIKPKPFQTTALKYESSTRTPIKCNDSRNLSNLELSINDSCFLTPRRNAMLSPNSIVWMSGRKYLDSKSPEIRAFNKRESIAMILKTNSGHVQAKVHLYDDLVRESVDTTPGKPSHSTPTSKLSRNSLSSQSMKSTPKQRKNASNDKFTPKKLSVSRSKSLRNENVLKSCQPKFILHTDAPSPIKSLSLKDVTNTSIGSKSSINLKIEKTESTVINRKKLKRNSFSGNNSKKSVKRISRSESSPGCQRPYPKVTCLIQE